MSNNWMRNAPIAFINKNEDGSFELDKNIIYSLQGIKTDRRSSIKELWVYLDKEKKEKYRIYMKNKDNNFLHNILDRLLRTQNVNDIDEIVNPIVERVLTYINNVQLYVVVDNQIIRKKFVKDSGIIQRSDIHEIDLYLNENDKPVTPLFFRFFPYKTLNQDYELIVIYENENENEYTSANTHFYGIDKNHTIPILDHMMQSSIGQTRKSTNYLKVNINPTIFKKKNTGRDDMRSSNNNGKTKSLQSLPFTPLKI